MTGHSGGFVTSIDQLIANFRESLIALVPSMEQARIPWREGEAYDEWDTIAEALFSAIVCSSVAHLLDGCRPLARYGFSLPVNDPPSLICAWSKDGRSRKGALVYFSTAVMPFDFAHIQLLTSDWTSAPETIELPIESARFSMLLRRSSGVEEVSVVEVPE